MKFKHAYILCILAILAGLTVLSAHAIVMIAAFVLIIGGLAVFVADARPFTLILMLLLIVLAGLLETGSAQGQQPQKPQTVEQLQCGIVSDYLSAAQKSLELQRRQIIELDTQVKALEKENAELKAKSQ